MPNYGTSTIADLLATTSQSVIEFGTDRIYDAFTNSLAAHNAQMMEVLGEFVSFTTDRLIGTGGLVQGDFQQIDEFGKPRVQKVTAGLNLGLPMNLHAYGQQWTRTYLLDATPRDLAVQFVAALQADRRNNTKEVKKAMYLSGNYTHVDVRRKDRASIPVKRLANADSFELPVGPNGEVFTASSHTHYLARAGGSVANTDLDALINTVAEHNNTGTIKVAIHSGDEATVRAFTGFNQVVDTRIVMPTTATYARGDLDVADRANRLIGIYNGAEIWVKPWAIQSYYLAWTTAGEKVCGYRTRRGIGDTVNNPGQLALAFEYDHYPLQSRGFEREFGVGVLNRVGAAVLFAGNTSYTDPTIN